jgi:hypothetical protein
MPSDVPQAQAGEWILKNGPGGGRDSLGWAIVHLPSVPTRIADRL